jgi:hypothetical protein
MANRAEVGTGAPFAAWKRTERGACVEVEFIPNLDRDLSLWRRGHAADAPRARERGAMNHENTRHNTQHQDDSMLEGCCFQSWTLR